jgi:hypothetical protein
MRERPIIFNVDMVRAVLDGRKTQTRRIMRVQPDSAGFESRFIIDSTKRSEIGKWCWAEPGVFVNPRRSALFPCPFGEIGDRLWVRETWMADAPRDGTWGDVEFYGCKGSPLSMIPERYRTPEHCIHRAGWVGHEMVGWTPSIHMPRWASRITLEITGVRVERLWDISEDDAKAEGCKFVPLRFKTGTREVEEMGHTAIFQFGTLWESIYGDENWQANPWVWVIEFKRVEVE